MGNYECPEFVLKSNKNVHLPARVSFLYLLGDLVVTERDFGWECSG